MTCKDCKFWSGKRDPEHLGFCNNGFWNIAPNYYEESDQQTSTDGVSVTYTPSTGKDFGCIHFEYDNN